MQNQINLKYQNHQPNIVQGLQQQQPNMPQSHSSVSVNDGAQQQLSSMGKSVKC